MFWILDAEICLEAMGLRTTIKEGNIASWQNRAKAMIFLRHHLDEGLKSEYFTMKDTYVLWSNLKERYDHQNIVILPKAPPILKYIISMTLHLLSVYDVEPFEAVICYTLHI